MIDGSGKVVADYKNLDECGGKVWGKLFFGENSEPQLSKGPPCFLFVLRPQGGSMQLILTKPTNPVPSE